MDSADHRDTSDLPSASTPIEPAASSPLVGKGAVWLYALAFACAAVIAAAFARAGGNWSYLEALLEPLALNFPLHRMERGPASNLVLFTFTGLILLLAWFLAVRRMPPRAGIPALVLVTLMQFAGLVIVVSESEPCLTSFGTMIGSWVFPVPGLSITGLGLILGLLAAALRLPAPQRTPESLALWSLYAGLSFWLIGVAIKVATFNTNGPGTLLSTC